MLISALMCGILSAVGKILENSRLPLKNPGASSSSWSEVDVLILAGTIGHVLSLGASSFIEEEHQTCSEHKSELSVLAAISLVMIFVLVQRRCSLVSKIAMALGLLGVYSYRAAIGNVIFPWQHDSKDISK